MARDFPVRIRVGKSLGREKRATVPAKLQVGKTVGKTAGHHRVGGVQLPAFHAKRSMGCSYDYSAEFFVAAYLVQHVG